MLHQASVPPPLPLAGVEVVLVPGKGRGMRATTSFKPGDIIVDEEPFVAVAMTEAMDQPVCHNDLMRVEEEDLKTCQGCKRTRYSSKAAQKSDWHRGHKYECKALRSPHSRPNSLHRLIARVLWKRGAEMKAQAEAKATADAQTAAAGNASPGGSMQSGGGDGTAPSYWHSCEAVAAMQGSTGLFSGLSRASIANLLSSLRCHLAQSKAPHFSDEKLQEQVMLQVMSNSYSMPDLEHDMSLGLGLYLMGALLNHSPRPNCGQAFHRGRLQIRALRAISPGDDLEITYTDVHEPTFVQRADLLNRYGFDLRPELPTGNRFPGARTERLGGCVRATLLDAAAAASVLLDAIDAAHCAVHSPPSAAGGLAPEATRFCHVVVIPDSDMTGMAMFGPMLPKEQLEGELTLAAARQVLREAWLPEEGTSEWLGQVKKERWNVEVTVMGDWGGEEEWQAAAYAATFAVAAHAWSKNLMSRGEAGMAHHLLLKAEAAGREAGLADSNKAMRPLLSDLLTMFMKQAAPSRTLAGGLPENAQRSVERAKRYEKATRAIHPEGFGELGWDLDHVAEVHFLSGDMRGALRLWQEGAQLLRASFGEPRGVMGIVFKAEFFLDDDEDRRAEVAERLGPSLPEAFTRGIPG